MCPFKVTQLKLILHWKTNWAISAAIIDTWNWRAESDRERTSSEPQKIQEKEVETNARFRYLMKDWKDSGETGFSLPALLLLSIISR
jgi:hypothetical protein